MTDDWLDDLLDRHPGEPVPEGFAQRLRARIEAEESSADPQDGSAAGGRLLRPRFGSWAARAAAAALLLAAGFWLGRDRPEIEVGPVDQQQDPVTAEGSLLDEEMLEEMFQNRELLESWDLATDEEIELGLRDAAVGTWDLTAGEGG